MRAALGKMGVGGRALDDVMDKVRNRHYQVEMFIFNNLLYLFSFYSCSLTLNDNDKIVS